MKLNKTNGIITSFVGTKKDLDLILVVGKNFDLRFKSKNAICPTCKSVCYSELNIQNIEECGECLACETQRGDDNQEQYDLHENN